MSNYVKVRPFFREAEDSVSKTRWNPSLPFDSLKQIIYGDKVALLLPKTQRITGFSSHRQRDASPKCFNQQKQRANVHNKVGELRMQTEWHSDLRETDPQTPWSARRL